MRRKVPLILGALCLAGICAISSVSAFFTDRVNLVGKLSIKDNFSVDNCILLSGFEEKNASGILPGDCVKMNPVVLNPHREDAYVFLEVSVPTVNSEGVKKPAFSYDLSTEWSLVESEAGNDKETRIYCYKEKLPARAETGAIFEDIKFLNVPGNESLSGDELEIDFRAHIVKAIKADENGKGEDKNKLLIYAREEKEEITKSYLKCARLSVGEFRVVIEDSKEGEEETEKEPEEVIVENVGERKAVIFLKIRALKEPFVKEGVTDLIKLGKDGDDYVFGLTTALPEGENTDNLISKIEVEGLIATRVVAIQADNLMHNGEKINTEGIMSEETLRIIYGILRGEGGFFTSEDEKEKQEVLKGGPGVKVEEIFDNSKKLTRGENLYEKRVSLKSVAAYSQFVRIKLDFSEEDIKDKVMLSPDGTSFFGLEEFKDNLTSDWEYVDEEGGYYLYKNELEKDGTTSSIFTHVKIDFENDEDVRDFDIYVIGEGRKEAFR